MKKSPLNRKTGLKAKRGLSRARKIPVDMHRIAQERRKGAGTPPTKGKGVAARRKARKAELFRRNFHSEEYVKFVQGLPCACGCGGSPCQVSHDPSRGAGGTWTETHPLTPDCHRRLGQGSATFWASVGRTREEANAETQLLWRRHCETGC